VNSYEVEMIGASFREASLEQTSGQSLALHVPQWFGAGNLEPEAQEAVVQGPMGGCGKEAPGRKISLTCGMYVKRPEICLSPPHPISSSLKELFQVR